MNKEMYKLILGIVILYICFVVMYLFFKSQKVKINWQQILYEVLSSTRVKKKYLVHYYGVDKATFRKWIKYFCKEVFANFEDYNQRRTLTIGESLMITSILGLRENEQLYVKKDIIKIGGGSYRSLKDSISQYPDRFGISRDVYVNLRIFPPNIGKRISEHY